MVGNERIHGEATTHYHALVDLTRYAATAAPGQRPGAEKYAALLQKMTGASSLPIDVWIGAKDRIRRDDTTLRMCSQEGTVDVTVSFELLHYGPQPAVEVPASYETHDVTSELKKNVSKGLQKLSCSSS